MQKVTRTMIGVHIDVSLAAKLKRLARAHGESLSDFCGLVLEVATQDEEYTLEDENAAHEMTVRNIEKRNAAKARKGLI